MRKILPLLAGIAMLAMPTIANAQVGTLLGFSAGLAIGSGSNATSKYGDAASNVLYVMPRAAERINDPLNLRVIASAGDGVGCADPRERQAFGAFSLAEHFARTVPDSQKYDVVQVVRTMRPGAANCLILWFIYIEKDKVTPLNQLRPLEQRQ